MRNALSPNFDPAEAVDPIKDTTKTLSLKPVAEVKKIRDGMPGGEPPNAIEGARLVDARVNSQIRLGVNPADVKPLRRSEVDDFGGAIRRVADGDYEQALKGTYDQIKKKYGEFYAGMIMNQVTEAEVGRSRAHLQARQQLIGMQSDNLVRPLTFQGVRDYEQELYRLETQEKLIAPKPRTWGETLQQGAKNIESEATDQGWRPPSRQPGQMFPNSEPPKPRIEPDKDAIDRLRNNPSSGRQFEADHNLRKGEALRYLLELKKK
jgi:hypothetical protein